MTTALRTPTDLDLIDPGWMTAALSTSHPGVQVDTVRVLLRDDGTNRRARLGLTYRSGNGPGTVFVKASDPAHAELNARTGGALNEAWLFASDVDLPVEHPAVHASVFDEERLEFILVMEDVVASGGEPCDATRPIGPDQVVSGVRSLAGLHSAFWGDRFDEHPGLAWVQPFRPWRGMARGIDIGLARIADLIPAEVARLTGEQIESGHWSDYVATLSDGPSTLLHGDAHIGNAYLTADGEIGFLDWQVLRRGNHTVDLGYFLQGALTVEDRRAHEDDLVAEYHDALDVPDGRPTIDDVRCRYRASAAHGLALWAATAASDDWQRPEVSVPLAQRYATAFADLGSIDAIARLRQR